MVPKILAAIVAGALATVLWPMLEGYVVALLPLPTSGTSWRVVQFIAGALCALVVTSPVVLLIRPRKNLIGALYVTSVCLTQVFAMLAIGAQSDIGMWVSLPDTWAFLLVSLGIFVWGSRRHAPAAAA